VDQLTAHGWAELHAYGVRTVIDLPHDHEPGPDLSARPADVATVHPPLDGIGDREFWDEWEFGPQYGTPLYYDPFLKRFPDRVARGIRAIAEAPPGGVLFHCGHGRSRAGLISLIVRAVELGLVDEAATSLEFLTTQGTTAADLILATLAKLDVEDYLHRAGLSDDELDAVRARLVA
jgi:protein-tyrosine phosphatase